MSIRLMSQIWDNEDPELTGSRLVILLCLADHANDTGDCWPSIERLAKRARLSKVSTMTHLQELEAISYITVERRLGAHNIYHVNAAPTTPRAERLPKAGNVANLKTSQDSATGKVDLTSQDSATPTSCAILTTTSQATLTTPVKVAQHEPSVNPHENHQGNQQDSRPIFMPDYQPASKGRALAKERQAAGKRVSAELLNPITNVILDITGKRAAVDAGDDALLSNAQEKAERLYYMGYKSEADLLALEADWAADWRGKSGGGTFQQFVEFVSEKTGDRRNGSTPKPPGKATIRVDFGDGQVLDQEITTHG